MNSHDLLEFLESRGLIETSGEGDLHLNWDNRTGRAVQEWLDAECKWLTAQIKDGGANVTPEEYRLERRVRELEGQLNDMIIQKRVFEGCLAVEEHRTLRVSMEKEKERRCYYQSIVYTVCRELDRVNGETPGQGVVCGCLEEPSKEVEERIHGLVSHVRELRRESFLNKARVQELEGVSENVKRQAQTIKEFQAENTRLSERVRELEGTLTTRRELDSIALAANSMMDKDRLDKITALESELAVIAAICALTGVEMPEGE